MPRLPFVALTLAAFGLACGGLIEKADNEKPDVPAAPATALPAVPPPAVTPPPAPPEPVAPAPPPVLTFAQVAFPCCAAHRANRIVNEYLDLQAALASDDLQRARAEAGAVRGAALAAAKDGSLAGESRTLAQQVADISGQLKGGDLTQIRGGFGNLSDKVITLARSNRGGTGQVAVVSSSKANATWLQKEAAVANPYFGKADASEGAFQE